MKRSALAFLSLALAAGLLAGCSSLAPFSQKQLDRLNGFPFPAQADETSR